MLHTGSKHEATINMSWCSLGGATPMRRSEATATVTCDIQRSRSEVAALQRLLRALLAVHVEVQQPAQAPRAMVSCEHNCLAFLGNYIAYFDGHNTHAVLEQSSGEKRESASEAPAAAARAVVVAGVLQCFSLIFGSGLLLDLHVGAPRLAVSLDLLVADALRRLHINRKA